jgi:hypothetical protein
MAEINYQVRYKRFIGDYNSMFFNTTEIIYGFISGLRLNDSKVSSFLAQGSIRNKILSAQQKIENELSLKFWEQKYFERIDYTYLDWRSWGYVRLSQMIKHVYKFRGFLADNQQVNYPITWMAIRRMSDERQLSRNLNIVATGQQTAGIPGNAIAIGMIPFMGAIGIQNIPNYWQIDYLTGFKNTPGELQELLGKLSSIPILTDLQDIVFTPGIASKSISYDGLSETVSTTRAGEHGIYAARLKAYEKYVETEMPKMRDYYVGIQSIVL